MTSVSERLTVRLLPAVSVATAVAVTFTFFSRLAILAALRERWAAEGLAAPTPSFVAGHSMGQYTALVNG